MKNIIVFGASGHAKVVIDIIQETRYYTIQGIVDKSLEKGSLFQGYPVLGDEEELKKNISHPPCFLAIIAIGDNRLRKSLASNLVEKFGNISFASVIHPRATIAKSAIIEPGTVIMAGATVNPDVRIGAHVIVNTNASVDHDCNLGNYSSIAPNSALAGNVTVEMGAFVGIGASVLQNLTIGKWTKIGGGAVVVKNIPENSVAFGNPAKIYSKVPF